MNPAFHSPTYPYERVMPSFLTFRGAEEIPHKLLTYLMDLPLPDGYEPVDDNTRPRVRLMKYLWHDGAKPLGERLPTAKEKQSLLFDGNEPVVDSNAQRRKHPKGYRLYAQKFWGEAQTEAKSTIKCYLGRIFAQTPFDARIGITFVIACNVNQETTTKTEAYARSYDMEQCIIEALNGVNIAGIGVCDFSRTAHADNGSRPVYDQTGTVVGRELKMSIHWAESESAMGDTIEDY